MFGFVLELHQNTSDIPLERKLTNQSAQWTIGPCKKFGQVEYIQSLVKYHKIDKMDKFIYYQILANPLILKLE